MATAQLLGTRQRITAALFSAHSNTVNGLIVLSAGLALWFMPPRGNLSPAAMHLTAIFIATILGLVLQPMPQGAVVILGVGVTAVTGTLSITDTMAGFADATVWLIVAAFLFARGFIKTGLGRRIAFLLVRAFGRSTLGLAYAITLADTVIAPATPSNTARAGGILFPIVRSLASSMDSEPGPTANRIGAFLMFNEFQSSVITSAIFLTGMAANSMVVKLAKETWGYNITWIGWLWAALVPGLVSLVALPYLLYRLMDPEIKHSPEATAMAQRELVKMGPVTLGERVMLVVFAGALVLWATGQWTGLNATAIALASVAVLLVLNVLDWNDVLTERGGWDALIWFGGLVGLAAGLSKLGVISLLAATLKSSLSGVGFGAVGFILVALAFNYAHYFIASATAHATALFVPLALVAVSMGAPVPLVVMALAFLNNLNSAMTHYGIGSAPIYFGAGYIDQRTWWKNGLIVSIFHCVVWLGVGGLWWKVIGLW